MPRFHLTGLLVVLLIVFAVQIHAQDDLNILEVEVSPTGQYVVGVGNTVILWDQSMGVVSQLPLNAVPEDIIFFDVSWSPDGSQFATISADQMLRVWDVSSVGFDLSSFSEVFVERVVIARTLAWSPDGDLVAIAGDSQQPLQFWNPSTLEFVRETSMAVVAVDLAWNPNSVYDTIAVVEAFADGSPTITSVSTVPEYGEIICVDCVPGAASLSLAWNSTGELLAIGHSDGTIVIVDVDAANTPSVSMVANGRVSHLSWSFDDRLIASAASGNLQIWDVTTGDLVDSPGFATTADFNPITNTIFVFDSRDDSIQTVEVTEEPTDTPTPTFTPTPTNTPTSMNTPAIRQRRDSILSV